MERYYSDVIPGVPESSHRVCDAFSEAVHGLIIDGVIFNRGFRPHFLTVCNPDIIALQAAGVGTGYQNIMFDRSICRPTDERHLQDAMKSFPSGHSAAAMAGFVYLALYFNAKMKIFSVCHSYWRL